jgi:hypothetical protein
VGLGWLCRIGSAGLYACAGVESKVWFRVWVLGLESRFGSRFGSEPLRPDQTSPAQLRVDVLSRALCLSPLSLPVSLLRGLFLSGFSLTPETLTHTFSDTYSLSRSLSRALSRSLTFALTHSPLSLSARSLTLSFTRTHTLSVVRILSLSLSVCLCACMCSPPPCSVMSVSSRVIWLRSSLCDLDSSVPLTVRPLPVIGQ